MGLQSAGSFREYREATRCVDCGRRGTLREDLKGWLEHRRWVRVHNQRHRTASEDELREHERQGAASRAMAARFMEAILHDASVVDPGELQA